MMYQTEIPVKGKSNSVSREVNEVFLFFRFIRQYKWRFILVVVLLSACSYPVFLSSISYSSKISLFSSDPSAPSLGSGSGVESEMARIMHRPAQLSLIYAVVYSQKMTDFLIDHFGLMAHYRVDSTKLYARQKVRQMLMDNLSISQEMEGIYTLRVKDHQSYVMSTNIANEIAERIRLLAAEIQLGGLRNNIKVYDALYEEINEQLQHDSREIMEATQSLKTLVESTRSLSLQNYAYINSTLVGLSDKVNADYEKMAELNKLRNYALKALEETKLSAIYSLGEALPESNNYAINNAMIFTYTILKSIALGAFLALLLFFLAFEFKVMKKRYTSASVY